MKSLRSRCIALFSLLLVTGCSRDPLKSECNQILNSHFEIVEELNQSLPSTPSVNDPMWIPWLYQLAATHRRAAEQYASIQVSDPTLKTLQAQQSQYFQKAAQYAQDNAEYYEQLKQNPTATRDADATFDEQNALIETSQKQSEELLKYCDFESWLNGSLSIRSVPSRN